MKIILFASSIRSYFYLINIFFELRKRNYEVLILYSKNPINSINPNEYEYQYSEGEYKFEGNIELLPGMFVHEPDLFIFERERWLPEQKIIENIKKSSKSKVGLIEVNTELLQVYENIMEYHSRNQHPQNQIDIYFEQSKLSLQKRIDAGFANSDKSLIVGNPKYDSLNDFKIDFAVRKYFSEKYSLDFNRKTVLYYSNMGLGRDKMMEGLKEFYNKHNEDYNIFYKPFNHEHSIERYHKDFVFIENTDNPGTGIFRFKDMQSIQWVDQNEIDMFYLSHIADIHIGTISSVMYFPLVLNKKVVNINNICGYENKGTDMSSLFEKNDQDTASGETGIPADFWKRIFKLNSDEELVEIINPVRLDKFKKENIEIRKMISRNTIDWDEEFEFLNKDIPDNKELLKYYDDFNDFNSSVRIVDEIEKL